MINIFISPDKSVGYVWNANDWQRIREEFRIIGHLSGSLPNYPRQDTFFGLPMCLFPEEITLLKEKQVACLIQCPSLLHQPNDEIKKRFHEEEAKFHNSKRQVYLNKKRSEVERSLNAIIEGKQKKDNNQEKFLNREKLISEEINKIQSISVGSHVICTSTGDPWIDKSEFVEVNWTYPSTEQERLRFDVFKDLWERNYCLTSGAKFGGDFLCYLGDPVKFHASFIVLCQEADADTSCIDMVVRGRIGSYTRKTFVFASRFQNSIVYHSLQWMGNLKE